MVHADWASNVRRAAAAAKIVTAPDFIGTADTCWYCPARFQAAAGGSTTPWSSLTPHPSPTSLFSPARRSHPHTAASPCMVEAKELHLARFLHHHPRSPPSLTVSHCSDSAVFTPSHTLQGHQRGFPDLCSSPLETFLGVDVKAHPLERKKSFRQAQHVACCGLHPCCAYKPRPLLPLFDSGSNAAAPQDAQLWQITARKTTSPGLVLGSNLPESLLGFSPGLCGLPQLGVNFDFPSLPDPDCEAQRQQEAASYHRHTWRPIMSINRYSTITRSGAG
eukprot:754794-Hanusia_phi.AAC.8